MPHNARHAKSPMKRGDLVTSGDGSVGIVVDVIRNANWSNNVAEEIYVDWAGGWKATTLTVNPEALPPCRAPSE